MSADEGRGGTTSDFGTLLRRYRLEAGLSQEALAERARLSLNSISALERGYRRSPQRETLALLIAALALRSEQREAFETAATRQSLPRRRGSTEVTVGPWATSSIGALPVTLTQFVGRTTELDEIRTLMREHRLVTVTGAAGIGKTQTALRVATAPGADPPICFIDLASIDKSSLVVPAVATALAVQAIPHHPLLETLAAYLKCKNQLLILDNCEHVVAEVAPLSETLLLNCPGVQILATSREPLKCAGERTYRLPSLAPAHAIALFVDRARASEAQFALTDANAPIVAEICRRLDGIPLAIELAAAHVNVLSVAALSQKLDDRFQVLTGGGRTALPRQKTMHATIDWSYDLLSAPEQRVFERLSIFVGGCTLASATTVCAGEDIPRDEVLTILASLVAKSLVVADLAASEPRYWTLESFRQYAMERLVARGEENRIARLHALACLDLAHWFNRAIDCELAAIVRERGTREAANWRAALNWTLAEREDVVMGQQLAGQLGPYFSSFVLATARNTFFFGHIEGRRWIDMALALVDENTPRDAVAALRYAEARVNGNLRRYRAELESSEIALANYRDLGDLLGFARAQSALSHALIYLGRCAEARTVLDEALQVASRLGTRSSFSVACLLRLRALATEDDVGAARSYVEQAMHIHSEFGHESSFAAALLDLSECEFLAGNPEMALERAKESLEATPIGNAFAVCSALFGMSLCLASLGRYDEAQQHAREALDLAREYCFDAYVAWALEQLAAIIILRAHSHTETADDAYTRAARILGSVNARLSALGSVRLRSLQAQYNRVITLIRNALGSETVAVLMAEGATMSGEHIFEQLLRKPSRAI